MGERGGVEVEEEAEIDQRREERTEEVSSMEIRFETLQAGLTRIQRG